MELVRRISEELNSKKIKWSTNFEIRNKAHTLADKIFELVFDNSGIELKGEKDLIETRWLLSDLLKNIIDEQDVNKSIIKFLQNIPKVVDILVSDIEAVLKFDPTTKNKLEIVLSYPGIYAITVYRFSHILYNMKIPILPRLMSEYAHGKTGIDIHPGAQIEESFFIDHGTGIVIGETAVIKKNVKIYQGATLGALSVNKTFTNIKRHPTIEENVLIYANATILGGETIIGKNSIIGGNVFITKSIPPDSIVYSLKESKVSPQIDPSKILDFQI